MADRVKGITIEFRGDTTDLSKAINKVRNETKDFEKELGYIDKSLKFNPKNVDLLRQKIAVLSDATEKGEKNIDEMKKALEEMKSRGIDETSADYRELEREIIKAEDKQKKYNAELRRVKAAASRLGQVSAKLKDLGQKATAAGNALKPVSAAGAAVDVALAGLAYKSGKAADDLNTLSKVTGIGTDKLQQYAAASDLVDVSVETIAKSQTKLKKSMYDAAQGFDSLTVAEDGTVQGGNAALEAFDKLGVKVVDSNGELRNQEEVFQETIAALGTMTNETERDALAQQIFGKSAAELNPLIEDQGKTYKQVADIFANNDLSIVDQETIDKANQFNDQIDLIKATGMAALSSIGMQLAGYLAPALEKVAGAIEKVFTWVSNLSPQTLVIVGIIAGVVAALAPLLIIVGKIAFAISSITGLMSTLGLSFGAIAGPIGIAIAAIAAIIAIGVLLYKNWDKIKAKAKEIKDKVVAEWEALKNGVIQFVTALKTGVINAWDALKNKVVSIVTGIRDRVVGIWNGIKEGVKNIALSVTVWTLERFSAFKSGISNIVTAIKDGVVNRFTAIKDRVKSIVSALVDFVKQRFETAKYNITHPIERAKDIIKGIIDKIKGLFGALHINIPNIKLPHFSISPPGWKFGDLLKGSIPSLGIRWYDKGGIFRSPSVIGVGERRPEFVGALDDLRDIVREEAGASPTINIYAAPGMDAKEIAREAIKELIKAENRRRTAWA